MEEEGKCLQIVIIEIEYTLTFHTRCVHPIILQLELRARMLLLNTCVSLPFDKMIELEVPESVADFIEGRVNNA
jgi:hypothetical protein